MVADGEDADGVRTRVRPSSAAPRLADSRQCVSPRGAPHRAKHAKTSGLKAWRLLPRAAPLAFEGP
jgi:hypothetical protein